MIRVVQVLEATAGGTRRHLSDLVEALPSDEFEVVVVCATRRDPSFREDIAAFRARGIEVHELPMVRAPHPVMDALAVRRLRALLRARPPSILHLHSSKAGWLGRLAAWDLECTVVYAPHCFAFLQKTVLPLGWMYAAAERVVARRTDVLFAVGEAEGALALERGLCDRNGLCVIPNAVDVAALEARVGARRPVPDAPQDRVVAFIGELRAQKTPFVFLEALRMLEERGLSFRSLLPARGPLLDAVRRFLVRSGLTGRVELVPAEESLAPLLRRADVAVLPSRWEGLPYSLLDALALSIPVIGSDIVPLGQVLRPLDERLSFREGSAGALAERMSALLTAPGDELRSIGAKGRALVRRSHSAADWRRSILDLYRSLAAEPARATRRKSSSSSQDVRRRSKCRSA